MRITGRTISAGEAGAAVMGLALVSRQTIAFSGDIDLAAGVVRVQGHELEGQSLAGKILALPSGEAAPADVDALARLKQHGLAPVAILTTHCDAITAAACRLAGLPGIDRLPVEQLSNGQRLLVQPAAGSVEVLPPFFGPPEPLPDPLRGLDPGTFTEDSMHHRLPRLVRRVIREGDWPAHVVANLEGLAREMPYTSLRPIQDPTAPDSALWAQYMAPYVWQNWLEAPWFPAEAYLFRRILEATGYYRGGAHAACAGVDPYLPQKQAGMEDTLPSLNQWAQRLEGLYAQPGDAAHQAQVLAELVRAAVWGNQADLSVWPAGGKSPDEPEAGPDAHLLRDDSLAAIQSLAAAPGPVAFLLDNCGLELAFDLLVADALLQTGMAARVDFYVKPAPTYVSDVTAADLSRTLAYYASVSGESAPAVRRLAQRLLEAVAQGRFGWRTHAFWVSPLSGWQMPADLWAELHSYRLLISKGDANYRRWLGDRHWPFDASFAAVTAYRPAPILAMRVLKSEIVVGLSPEQPAALFERDPHWLFSGAWALVQFSET